MADILITVRADRPELVSAGSVFDFCCARCGQKVVLSRSSLAVIPTHEVVCTGCLTEDETAEAIGELSDHSETILERVRVELSTAQPNPWKRRN